MDTGPLWFQTTSAIIVDLGSLAAIVGYLWPVWMGKETIPELLRRRFSGGQAPSPSKPRAPQPKNQRRAILNILALVVPLLIIVGPSAFLGSLFLPHREPTIMGTPTPHTEPTLAPTATPTLAPTATSTPSPTLSPGSEQEFYDVLVKRTSNIADPLNGPGQLNWQENARCTFIN